MLVLVVLDAAVVVAAVDVVVVAVVVVVLVVVVVVVSIVGCIPVISVSSRHEHISSELRLQYNLTNNIFVTIPAFSELEVRWN